MSCGTSPMHGDEIVVHVARMGGGVADPHQALDLGDFPDEPREPPGGTANRARRSFAVIGVDVLAEQREFDRARRHQAARLLQHRRRRPRIFGAPRIGHDAEGAELVATLLDGEERRAGAHVGLRRRRQMVEFALGGKFGVEHAGAGPAPAVEAPFVGLARHPGQQFGQAVIGLRPDDDIDRGLALDDLLALGLGHAARHGDGEVGAVAAALEP